MRSDLKRMTLALIGTWTLLAFALAQPAPDRARQDVAGNWEGKLVVAQSSLRIWLEVTQDQSGELSATLYSLDQGATPIPCTNVSLRGDAFRFEVPAVSGTFVGQLDASGNTIDGTWTQGQSLPLTPNRPPPETNRRHPARQRRQRPASGGKYRQNGT